VRYQRNITSTLTLLAVALLLFVGYQVWLKPAYLDPKPAADPASTTTSASPTSALTFPGQQKNPTWDVPASRLVELGPAPDSTLEKIRDELDRGNYGGVEPQLKALSHKKLTHVPTRQYIAGLWNNLGIQQEKFGGTALSVKAFKQAVSWDPSNPLAHLNLTQAYWELRDPAMTPQFLETVIRLAPQDPFPHLALADLLLAKGNASLAAKHLDLVRTRAERDPNNQSYLRKLLAKIPKSELVTTAAAQTVQPPPSTQPDNARTTAASSVPVMASNTASRTPTATVPSPATPPPQPPRSSTAHFIIQFDGPADQTIGTQMRAILEYAHDELTQKFGHVPSKPITVVLHTAQKFASTAGTPAWADTLFDRSSGTIHLPTQGALEDLAILSRIARHEFVHALLFEHVKGAVAAVPHWLLEGLALQLTEDPWPDLDEGGQQAGAFVPLPSLQGEWIQLTDDARQSAYREARSATQHLLDRYSMYGVRQVINVLATGQAIDAAMQQKLSVSYDQFQRQWEQTYRSSMTPSRS
jgi:tetratricopeptide (TPR) repeat protein